MATRARFSDGRPTTRETMAAYDSKVFAPTLPTMPTGIQFISESDLKREEEEARRDAKIRQKKKKDREERLLRITDNALQDDSLRKSQRVDGNTLMNSSLDNSWSNALGLEE